jgi:hypothetical protein
MSGFPGAVAVAVPKTVVPVVDVPLEEAVKDLTGFEVLEIEKHYKGTMDNLGGTKMLIGTIHAYRNRQEQTASWNAVEAMTLREMTEFFAEPAPEPDGEQGNA